MLGSFKGDAAQKFILDNNIVLQQINDLIFKNVSVAIDNHSRFSSRSFPWKKVFEEIKSYVKVDRSASIIFHWNIFVGTPEDDI